MGRLSGPELVVGDTSYRAGDRIVTLAPGARGEVVTSECGTVLAVDVRRGELAVTMDDDGRIQRFGPEEIDASHLAHGYAVTVHRAQGATVTRAHALEDGGGRELAYVKMSRARERSAVYVVADSPEQAVEDLSRSWGHSRRIGWAIDSGTPTPDAPTLEPARPGPAVSASLRHARLVAEREAVAAVVPTDPGFVFRQAEGRVRRLERELQDLDRGNGWGVWKGTPVGEAAIDWQQAVEEHRTSLAQTDHAGFRDRRQLRQRAERALERAGPLREAFERLAAPERARICAELPEARRLLDELQGQYWGHLHFKVEHPEALRRLERLDRELAAAAFEVDLQRQGIDGIAAELPQHLQPRRGIERDAPTRDRGIDFGLGL